MDSREILKSRFILAKQFNCPPDKIIIEPILKCFERSLEKSFLKNGGKGIPNDINILLYPQDEEEIDAFTQNNIKFILDMILNNRYPFETCIDEICNKIEMKYKLK